MASFLTFWAPCIISQHTVIAHLSREQKIKLVACGKADQVGRNVSVGAGKGQGRGKCETG